MNAPDPSDIVTRALMAINTQNELAAARVEIERLKKELAEAQENYHLLNERVARIIKESKITKTETGLLSQKEAARILGVTKETVSRWTSARTIPCVRIGLRSVRYVLEEIVGHARSRRNNQSNG